MFVSAVLPPVPTAGLTIEDVSALTASVRDQMLNTLREISVNVSSSKPEKSDDSRASPRPSVVADLAQANAANEPSEVVPSPLVATSNSDDTSSASGSEIRKEGSENGAETEEDEGMVLVGRPQ